MNLVETELKCRPVSANLADVINEVGSMSDLGDAWKSFRVANHLLSKITRLEYTLATYDHRLHPSLLGTARIVRKCMSKLKKFLAFCQVICILTMIVGPSEKSVLLRHFQQTMSTVSWQKKEDLLNTLIDEAEKECLDRASLEVLQRALFSVGGSRHTSLFTPMTLTAYGRPSLRRAPSYSIAGFHGPVRQYSSTRRYSH